MAWNADWGTSGDLIYQYNYSHENEGGILMDCNTTYNHNWIHRYNLSVNEPGNQWTITAHEKGNIDFHNNTVYIAPGGGRFKIYAKNVSNVNLYNNIIVADTGDYTEYRERGNSFVNNLVYGSNHVAPYFAKNTIIADPQFVDVSAAEIDVEAMNNRASSDDKIYLANPGALDGWDAIKGWELTANSPAIDAGIPVVYQTELPAHLVGTRDLAGNAISGAGFDGKLDLGAFEYQGEKGTDITYEVAPMLASHGVEVEYASSMSEGIVLEHINHLNCALSNIQDCKTITFDNVTLDQNINRIIVTAHVFQKKTMEEKIDVEVVGEGVLYPTTT